jgi:hypothetical protein
MAKIGQKLGKNWAKIGQKLGKNWAKIGQKLIDSAIFVLFILKMDAAKAAAKAKALQIIKEQDTENQMYYSYEALWHLYSGSDIPKFYINIHTLLRHIRRIHDLVSIRSLVLSEPIITLVIHLIVHYYDASAIEKATCIQHDMIYIPYYATRDVIESNVLSRLQDYFRRDYTCGGLRIVTEQKAVLNCESCYPIELAKVILQQFNISVDSDATCMEMYDTLFNYAQVPYHAIIKI